MGVLIAYIDRFDIEILEINAIVNCNCDIGRPFPVQLNRDANPECL